MNFRIVNYNIDYSIYIILIVFIFLLFNYKTILFKSRDKFAILLLVNRFLILLIVSILLINPIISFKNYFNKNISIAIDNSSSMLINLRSININDQMIFNKIINSISDKGYNPILYKFSEKVEQINNIKNIDYNGNLTDFSTLIGSLPDNSIILTDGCSNHGPNSLDLINKSNINIVGFGKDKSDIADISLKLLSYEFFKDSVRINIELNNNLSLNLNSQAIYLSNSYNKHLLISEFNLLPDSYKLTKSIVVPEKYLSKNNLIYLDIYEGEKNTNNNSITINIENDIRKRDLLLISGTISSNTKYIKNNILQNLSNYNINHIYRLQDDIWSENVKEIDYSRYEMIVFDDYPKNNTDNDMDYIIKNFEGKMSYFLGPGKLLSDNLFLKLYDCKYEMVSESINNYKNDLILFNKNSYSLRPLKTDYKITCPNNYFEYDNGHSYLYLNNNISLFFIPNIFQFNQFSPVPENNDNYLVNSIIEEFVYSHSKNIDLFTNQFSYSAGDTLNAYIEINNGLKYDEIYLKIANYDSTFTSNVFYDGSNLDNFITLSTVLNESGNFYIQAFVGFENNNLFKSNTIEYSVMNHDIESESAYLNEPFLSQISYETGGSYYKYTNVDKFLDNIDLSNLNSVNYKRNKMISFPFIFIFLLCLFSFEWFLRNRTGLL